MGLVLTHKLVYSSILECRCLIFLSVRLKHTPEIGLVSKLSEMFCLTQNYQHQSFSLGTN